MNENTALLDLSFQELEPIVGLHCTPDVDPKTCDTLTGVGVGMSFVGITITIAIT